jgi:glucokinase
MSRAAKGVLVLAGDIGGTNTKLGLFLVSPRGAARVASDRYESRRYPGLADIVREFLSRRRETPSAACFGVAGPVRDGRCIATNMPWIVEARKLARVLTLPRVELMNDLEANAWGIPFLAPRDFYTVNRGTPDSRGNAAVIAAGTGLGEAGLFRDGRELRPFACEGGHADFSPADALQGELWRHLSSRFGHVSWERVLAGPGLVNIYRFLRESGRGREPRWLAAALKGPVPAAAISQAGLDGRSSLCSKALDLFVSLYGAEAGNLVLKLMATGGVYIGGGIAPKIASRFKGGLFMKAFADKGRMGPLLRAVPVRLILNDNAALLGAARRAAFPPAR